MGKFGIVSALLLVAWAPRAFSCGKQVTKVINDKDRVRIQLTDTTTGKSEFLLDTNGMLTVALLAAYCNQNLEEPSVKIPAEKQSCIASAKVRFPLDVNSVYTGGLPPTILEQIQSACGLNLEANLRKAKVAQGKENVTCGPQVREIARKAANGNEKYYQAMTTQEMVGMMARADLLEEFYVPLQRQHDMVKEFAAITAKDPLKRDDFNKWLFKFAVLTDGDSQYIFSSANETYTQETPSRKLRDTLAMTAPRFPGVTPQTCAFNISEEALAELRQASWGETLRPAGGGAGIKDGGGDGVKD